MKQLITLLSILILLSSCGSEEATNDTTDNSNETEAEESAKDQLSYQGKISGELKEQFSSVKLQIQNIGPNGPVFVELSNASVSENGSFELKGKFNGYGLGQIELDSANKQYVIIEPGKVEFSVNPGENGASFEFTEGSETANFLNVQAVATEFQEKEMKFAEAYSKKNGHTQEALQKFMGEYDLLKKDHDKILIEKIEAITPSFAGFASLSFVSPTTNKDFYTRMAAKYEADLENHEYATRFVEEVKRLKEVIAEGDIAPDFTMKTPKGNDISLSDFRGKYVLLDFWASWCRPCRMENPNVVRVYNKYKNKNFSVLSVSFDNDRDKWLRAIEEDNMTWNHISELKGWETSVVSIYKITGIPATYLLNPEGKIIAMNLRGPQLEQKLQTVIPD